MTPIDSLPDLEWSRIALEEMGVSGSAFIQESTVAFRIGDVAIAGLIYTSYLSPPWFWFASARGITLRDLIDFRRLAANIPKGALTGIRVGHEPSVRFAKLYGFEETEQQAEHCGITFTIFRKS